MGSIHDPEFASASQQLSMIFSSWTRWASRTFASKTFQGYAWAELSSLGSRKGQSRLKRQPRESALELRIEIPRPGIVADFCWWHWRCCANSADAGVRV